MAGDGSDHDLGAAIAALAEADPGREVCGFVVEDRDGDLSVLPVANVSDRPREAYAVDPAVHLALARRLRQEGGRIAAVFHSHVEGPARLSPDDLRWALHQGQPLLPGVDQVVVAVRGGKVEEIQAFAWDGTGYAEASPLARRVARVAPGAKSRPS